MSLSSIGNRLLVNMFLVSNASLEVISNSFVITPQVNKTKMISLTLDVVGHFFENLSSSQCESMLPFC